MHVMHIRWVEFIYFLNACVRAGVPDAGERGRRLGARGGMPLFSFVLGFDLAILAMGGCAAGHGRNSYLPT